MGPRPKLVSKPELTEQIAKLVREGNYLTTAAQVHGVAAATVSDWMRRGGEGEEPYAAFAEAIACARAEAEADMVSFIRNPPTDDRGRADPTVNRAMQWLLERTRRERFGVKIEVVAREEALRHVLNRLREGLDPGAFRAVLECLTGESGGGVPRDDGGADELH